MAHAILECPEWGPDEVSAREDAHRRETPRPSLTTAEIRRILEAGVLAPTAHNAQPWRFRVEGDRVECRREDTLCFRHLDFENGATHVGFGALVENMALEAATIGIRADVDLFPRADDPRLVCVVRLARDSEVKPEPELAAEIPRRCTNRRKGRRRPLSDAERAALTEAIAPTRARLLLATDPDALDTLARLVGRVDRITFSHAEIHREIFEGFRWTPQEVRANPHGLDVATLELAGPERAVVKMLSRWSAIRFLTRIRAGIMLEMAGRQAVATASAMGLIVHPGTSPESYVAGGRALERLWLAASRAGLGLQPLASLPFMFARLERGGGEGLDPAQIAELREMRGPYRDIFQPPEDHAEIMLFRLVHAPAPTARSVRRSLDDLLD